MEQEQRATPQSLIALYAERRRIEREIWDQVQQLRTDGHSWAVIGDCLGISRQAAHERFGPAASPGW
jgi:hypothetical protein